MENAVVKLRRILFLVAEKWLLKVHIYLLGVTQVFTNSSHPL